MGTPAAVSVNVGVARTLEARPTLFSAIDKIPAQGPVLVQASGLAGDEVGNPRDHGGLYQAVHAFAHEELDFWGTELGGGIRPGTFGENLTTRDMDLASCVIGEQWWVGSARLQVCSVRVGCRTFGRWLVHQRLLPRAGEESWSDRFERRGRSGLYLSVLQEGWVQAGDPISVVDRPSHGLTAEVMGRALTTQPHLLPLLLEVDGLPPRVYEQAASFPARREQHGFSGDAD